MTIDRELTDEEVEAIAIVNYMAHILNPIEIAAHQLPDNDTIGAAIQTCINIGHEAGKHSPTAVAFTRVAFDAIREMRAALDMFNAAAAEIADEAAKWLQENDGEA